MIQAQKSPNNTDVLVLVVEDDPDLRYILRCWLESLGARVREAKDGMAGLAQASSSPPDLIFCDVGLPQLDGCALVQKLKSREHLAHIPMVALTGTTGGDVVLRTCQAGFDAHLTKPVTRDMIAAQLSRFLPGATRPS